MSRSENTIYDYHMYSVNFMKKNTNKSLLHDYDGFINWINEVETIFFKEIGIYLLDVQDELYMDHYDEGYTPKQMAKIVIKHMMP